MADNLEGAPKPTLLSGMGKTHIVLPASFLMSASHGLITFGMVYYLRDAYGASAAVIGRFTAFYSLSYLAGCLLLKPLLSSLLPRRSMMISSAVMGTSVAGILLIRSLDTGFLLYGMFGFSIALFWPPLMGWLSAEREGPELTRTMGRFNLAWSSANVAAPLLAGLLFDIGPVLPIAAGIAAVFAVFFFVLAAALVLPRFRADTYREPRSREEAGPENRTPVRHIARLGVFSSYAMLGVLSTMFPLFGRENLLVSAGTVGALLLTRALATTAGFVFFGRQHGWHFRTAPHFLAQAAFAGMTLLLILAPSVAAYIVVLPLFGFASAYSYSSSLFHGAAGTPRRGRSMTIHEIVLNLGQILGAFGGGMFFRPEGCGAPCCSCWRSSSCAERPRRRLRSVPGERPPVFDESGNFSILYAGGMPRRRPNRVEQDYFFSEVNVIQEKYAQDAALVRERSVLKNVYMWMAAGLALTGIVALGVASNPRYIGAIFSNRLVFFALLFAPVGIVMYLSARIGTLSAGAATLWFAAYAALNGVTLSIIFLAYTGTSIAATFFITAGTFAAMSVYAVTTKRDLSSISSYLVMGLWGVIIASLVNMFLKSPAFDWLISLIGVAVFIGLTAYDTQVIKNWNAQAGYADDESVFVRVSIMGALKLYLDFINLFLFMLRFFGRRRN